VPTDAPSVYFAHVGTLVGFDPDAVQLSDGDGVGQKKRLRLSSCTVVHGQGRPPCRGRPFSRARNVMNMTDS
jgi:hypothetical protein